MPTVYITGVNAEGRSCVQLQREISMESGAFEALRLNEPITPIAASSPEVPLLEAMTPPGGAYYNVFVWGPGEGTELHRTVSTDVDVVLHGSVELGLETETVLLSAGDIVVLHGNAHSWRGGQDGGIMLFNLVAGSATGGDVGRECGQHVALDKARSTRA